MNARQGAFRRSEDFQRGFNVVYHCLWFILLALVPIAVSASDNDPVRLDTRMTSGVTPTDESAEMVHDNRIVSVFSAV
jgi:hypothetical protein